MSDVITSVIPMMFLWRIVYVKGRQYSFLKEKDLNYIRPLGKWLQLTKRGKKTRAWIKK